jgi:hypothetical protein
MSGQVNRDTKFGEYIYNLSLRKDVNNIVEIGTWNGQGSTKCVMDALLTRFDDSRVYSLEASEKMFSMATEYWNQSLINYQDFIKEKLVLIHGTIIDEESLMTLQQLKQYQNYDSRWEEWLAQDIDNMKTCSNVLSKIPQEIDFLILDGGEFSTLAEFNVLKDRSRIIACDDTMVLKCSEIRRILLEEPNYACLIDEPYERNGFCIFEKR